MENTNTIQFPNDQAVYFLSANEGYRGPFKASEVYEKLQSKELTWIDYVYREQEGEWMRLADHPVFKALQAEPPKPKPKPAMAPPPPPKKAEETVKWFLYQNAAQTGPYPASELARLYGAGQISAEAFVWQEKFTDWKPYREVSELLPAVAPGAPAAPQVAQAKPTDRRLAPRKPLMAQLYLTNQTVLATGMCRDISVGGMQVLTDQIPGAVGTQIRLNVSPPSDSGLQPFVAEGEIVRILEDQRGFSFRFSQLSAEAKKSIESYIA